MSDAFEAELSAMAGRLEDALDALLPPAGERLADAMRHATLGGGKRLRGALLMSSAALFDAGEDGALRAACALELLHAYSLVHDDLPPMDDDDLRRGRPTVHRVFDEATAILAGDALQTLSFEIMAGEETHENPAIRAALVLELARAAGCAGMAGGQMRDLAAEGRFAAGSPLALGEEEVSALQAMKTGALFRYAAVAGAILGQALAEDRERMAGYGSALGAAFQIADDILDEEATAAELGKATAKDRGKGKATLPSLLGARASRQRLELKVEEARTALAPFGDAAEFLYAAAGFAAERRR